MKCEVIILKTIVESRDWENMLLNPTLFEEDLSDFLSWEIRQV